MSIWLNFKILSLACVLVLTACSTNKIVQTYDGAVLPNKAISILTAPENIILLSVNGQAVPQYMLSNLEVNYGLKAGENLIVFQYESIWSKAKKDDETGSRVELIKSDPLAVVIPALAGKNYNFNFMPASNVREAKKLAPNFVARIIDEQKNLVAESISLKAHRENSAHQKALEDALLAEKKVSLVSSSSLVSSETDLSVLDQLKVIWPTASADEKKAFLVWVFQR